MRRARSAWTRTSRPRRSTTPPASSTRRWTANCCSPTRRARRARSCTSASTRPARSRPSPPRAASTRRTASRSSRSTSSTRCSASSAPATPCGPPPTRWPAGSSWARPPGAPRSPARGCSTPTVTRSCWHPPTRPSSRTTPPTATSSGTSCAPVSSACTAASTPTRTSCTTSPCTTSRCTQPVEPEEPRRRRRRARHLPAQARRDRPVPRPSCSPPASACRGRSRRRSCWLATGACRQTCGRSPRGPSCAATASPPSSSTS